MTDATTRATADVVTEICGRIASGESVSAIFRAPGEGYPGIATFWRWLHGDDELARMYDRATEQRGEKYAEDIVDIADDEKLGWRERSVRIDARKWVASRMRPKRWGDRTILAGDADNPIRVVDDSAIAGKLLPELAAGATPGTASEPDA